jgi:hypothetical protein
MNKNMQAFGHLVLGSVMLLPVTGAAQSTNETFTATASVTSPAGTASTPVTVSIARFVTDAERTAIVTAVQANDQAATRKALEQADDIGYIDVGSRRTPIKYAYARPTGHGRLITVVTARPVAYVGASEPGAKPKGDYDLALALLVLDEHDTGDGEFSPAVTLRMDDQGAIVTTDYSHEVIRLTGISKVK